MILRNKPARLNYPSRPPQKPANGDHKALNRGTSGGGLGKRDHNFDNHPYIESTYLGARGFGWLGPASGRLDEPSLDIQLPIDSVLLYDIILYSV